MNPGQLGCTRLIAACACDRNDDILWHEFLRRYSSRIKQFIARVCLLRSVEAGLSSGALPRAIQPSDLFQSVIVRLVEKECAAMKAFTGTNEVEWLAYLAVITRSVVCELLRCRRATIHSARFAGSWQKARHQKHNQNLKIEQAVLAGEVKAICERTIRNLAGEHADRDILIFHLYYFHDASYTQIAACTGVNLTASGVKKVLHVLRHRVRNVTASDDA